MGKKCSYYNCNNTEDMPNVKLYRFPTQESRCHAWLKAAKNPKLYSLPYQRLKLSYRLCGSHFQEWCFTNSTSKHRLVHNAVPDCPKSMVRQPNVKETVTENPGLKKHSSSELAKVLISPMPGPVNTTVSPSKNPLCNSAPTSEALPVQDVANENQPNISLNQGSPCSSTPTTPSTSGRKYILRKAKLASEVKRQRDLIRRLRSKYMIIKKRIEDSTSLSLEDTLISKGVKPKLASFIQRQVKLSVQK